NGLIFQEDFMTKRKKIIVVFLFALFLIITQSVVDNAYFIHSSDLTLEQIDQQYHTHFQDYDFSLNTVKSFSLFNNQESLLLRSNDFNSKIEIEIANPSDSGFNLTHYNSRSSNPDSFYEIMNSPSVYHIKQNKNSYKIYCSTPSANLWISFTKTELEFNELIEILNEMIA
ncbi:hypothetical protein, partial [Holdemania filiformis]